MPNKQVLLWCVAAALCLASGARGQGAEADSVKGELHVISSTVLRAEVTLSDLQGGRPVVSASVGADGRFDFRHVPYGAYRLTVSGGGQLLHQEVISVHDQMQPIEIEVTAPEAPRAAAGTVSALELLHPPTKKAIQACLAAEKFSRADAHGKAVEQLEKAIQLSPEYTAAWINLAAQHIYLGQYEKALLELTHAGELAPPTALIRSNMAYAQFALGRYGDGIRSVREALRLDPTWVQAHYLLGSALVREGHTRTEGIEHLEIAARTSSSAQAELERVQREFAQVVIHP